MVMISKRYFLALLSVIFFLSAASSCSKHKNKETVPEVVIEEFDKDQPEAEKVYWQPVDDSFEARYIDNGVEKVVIYSPAGKKVRLEYVVAEQDVPVVVVTRLRKKYPGMVIEHVTYVERPRTKPFYIVRVKHPKALTNIEINLAGVILRTVVLESFVVQVKHNKHDHDDCDDHKHKHKHKHGKGHGHGHCKHERGHCNHNDHHAVGLINIKLKN